MILLTLILRVVARLKQTLALITVLTLGTLALTGGLVAQAQTTAPIGAQPPAKPPVQTPVQGAVKPPTIAKTATPITGAMVETKPLWRDLTPAQQASLKPLGANWSTIEEAQKRKWIALSNNYATLPPAEQQKMHSRMAEWSSLSQQQRTQARLNFAESNKLGPKEKAEKTATWEAYQALSPEDKQKLAAKTPKPAGAAMAIKPPAPEKLATVPSTRLSPKPNEQANRLSAVDGHTLQPKAVDTHDVPGAPGSVIHKN